MPLLEFLSFFLGLGLLTAGAEGLVRGGARLAAYWRVSPLVVGLTLVAFGTSAPELVVSVMACLKGQTELVVGNVVGSNIFNVLAVLGPAALLCPLAVEGRVVSREIPVMLGVSVLMIAMSFNGTIGREEGGLLFAGIVGYTWFLYAAAGQEPEALKQEYAEAVGQGVNLNPWFNAGLALAGTLMLLGGARLLVDSAVAIARTVGVSELVIGLTLVAFGTSLPEVATSLVAAFHKEADIAVGNVVGSCIFNILCITGVAALIRPLVVGPEVLRFDLPVMLACGVVLLPMIVWGRKHQITRLQGGVLFLCYLLYILTLLRTRSELLG